MRIRTKEIKIRLTEKELEQLNRMVEKSIFTREEFIRMRIAGYEIQEKPEEEISQLMIDIRNVAGALLHMRDANMFKKLTDKQTEEIMCLVQKAIELEDMLFQVYLPYYKEKQ